MRRAAASAEGFTLIEMLVVLTIIGVLAAVAMSNLSARPAFVDRAKLRTEFEAAVARASQQALASGNATRIGLTSLDTKELVVTSSLGAGNAPMAYPDGSTSGGTLRLKGQPLFSLDWMTGRVLDAPR